MINAELERFKVEADRWVACVTTDGSCSGAASMGIRNIIQSVHDALLAPPRPALEPTHEMIEAGAQRLVRWETGQEKWPDAWSEMDVRAARNDAERCWRSMWLVATGQEKA